MPHGEVAETAGDTNIQGTATADPRHFFQLAQAFGATLRGPISPLTWATGTIAESARGR